MFSGWNRILVVGQSDEGRAMDLEVLAEPALSDVAELQESNV